MLHGGAAAGHEEGPAPEMWGRALSVARPLGSGALGAGAARGGGPPIASDRSGGAQPQNRWTNQYTSAATTAAAGIVMNQPSTMFFATPQRTARSRLVAPAPMIAAVIT